MQGPKSKKTVEADNKDRSETVSDSAVTNENGGGEIVQNECCLEIPEKVEGPTGVDDPRPLKRGKLLSDATCDLIGGKPLSDATCDSIGETNGLFFIYSCLL